MRLIVGNEDVITIASGNKVLVAQKMNQTVSALSLEEGVSSNIVAVGVSTSDNIICFAYDNKWISSFTLSDGILISKAQLRKCPTALTLQKTGSGVAVIVSDKAGDVYGMNVKHLDQQMKLAGHTASIITDVDMSVCGRYMISSDRDEKVRISRFPDTYTIQSYAVGHESIVVGVTVMQSLYSVTGGEVPPLLCSASWDNSVRLWTIPEGKPLDVFHFPNETTTEEVPEVEAPSVGEEEGDEEGYAKQYVVTNAENMPLKVISVFVPLWNMGLVAVLLRERQRIFVLTVGLSEGAWRFVGSTVLEGFAEVVTDLHFPTAVSSSTTAVPLWTVLGTRVGVEWLSCDPQHGTVSRTAHDPAMHSVVQSLNAHVTAHGTKQSILSSLSRDHLVDRTQVHTRSHGFVCWQSSARRIRWGSHAASSFSVTILS